MEIEFCGKNIWFLVRTEFLIAVLVHERICNQLLSKFYYGPDIYADAPVY